MHKLVNVSDVGTWEKGSNTPYELPMLSMRARLPCHGPNRTETHDSLKHAYIVEQAIRCVNYTGLFC